MFPTVPVYQSVDINFILKTRTSSRGVWRVVKSHISGTKLQWVFVSFYSAVNSCGSGRSSNPELTRFILSVLLGTRAILRSRQFSLPERLAFHKPVDMTRYYYYLRGFMYVRQFSLSRDANTRVILKIEWRESPWKLRGHSTFSVENFNNFHRTGKLIKFFF